MRSVLRNLFRPWRGDSGRSSRKSRRGWRPIRRNLESGLHAVRPDPSGRAAEPAPSFHRHGNGIGTDGGRAPGKARQLRHRPHALPDRGHGAGGGDRPGRTVPGLPPGHRRSSAGLRLSHRRWGAAVERGAGLCSAPDHAAGHAPRPPDGVCRAPALEVGPRAHAGDGSGVRGTAAGGGADRRDVEAGGDPLQADARPGTEAARRTGRVHGGGGDPAGGRGVQALRHVRISPRSDPGRSAAARHRGRSGRLFRRHGAPARRGPQGVVRLGGTGDGGALVRSARQGGGDGIPRLRHRIGRRRNRRPDQRRRCRGPGRGGREGGGGRQPDSFLWRVGRPDGRPGRDPRGGKGTDRGLRHPEETRRPARSPGRHRGGGCCRRGRRDFSGRPGPSRRAARPPLGDAPPPRGASPGAGRTCGAEGIVGGRRPPAVRHQSPQGTHSR